MNNTETSRVRWTIRLQRISVYLATLAAVLGFQATCHAAKILYMQVRLQRDTVKLINILQAQGHELTIWDTDIDGAALTAAEYQAQGFELLILDEVIGSGNVGDKWRNSPIPVVNWEGFLYSGTRSSFVTDGGVTGGTDPAGDAGYGQVGGLSSINIIDPEHPLAAGLPAGEVMVWDPNAEDPGFITFSGGTTLIGGVAKVATVPGFDDRFSVFGVEAGTLDIDGNAIPARWVHLPWNNSEETRVMIEPSFFLFEAGVAWALGLPEPTKIHDLSPEGGASLAADSTMVSFSVDKVSNSGSAVERSAIKLIENGTDVSSALQIADGGDHWNVIYPVAANRAYTFVASATAADGGFSARMTLFDTFDPSQVRYIEAENFNFGGGQFFDEIVLCNNIGGGIPGCYFDRASVSGTDALDVNGNADDNPNIDDAAFDLADLFRYGPSGSKDEESDTFVSGDILRDVYRDAPPGPAGAIRDYDLERIDPGDWWNYTRTFEDGSYAAFLRVSSQADAEFELGLVTSNPAQGNQTVEKIGTFSVRGRSGYQFVSLTDAGVVRGFDLNGRQTLRLTANSGTGALLNYLVLAPYSEPATEPVPRPVAGLGAAAAYSLETSTVIAGAAGSGFTSLDGTWSHDNGSDEWDGSPIGGTLGDGNRPGGISVIDGYLRLQETGDPRDHGFSDPGSVRKIYFGHDIGPDGASATVLDDGATLFIRARLATDGMLDQLHPDGGGALADVPAEGDGYLIHDGGKSNFGIKQSAGGLISFALTTGGDTGGVATGLIMNNLNGTSVSGDVDSGEAGTANVLELDPTVWHDFRITIQADVSGTGTHRVDISVDGSPAQTFIVTAGSGSDFDGISYIAMGVGSTGQSGAIDVAAFQFAPGVIGAPPAAEGPQIQISRNSAGNIVLTFDGVLLGADSVEGPYTEVDGATSPLTVTPGRAQRFFQSRSSN